MLPTVLALAAIAVASAALTLMLGERAALRAAHRITRIAMNLIPEQVFVGGLSEGKFQFVEFPRRSAHPARKHQ
jgi:hypothetical protein